MTFAFKKSCFFFNELRAVLATLLPVCTEDKASGSMKYPLPKPWKGADPHPENLNSAWELELLQGPSLTRSQEPTPGSQENVKNSRAAKIFSFTDLGGNCLFLPSQALFPSPHAADPKPGQLFRKNLTRKAKSEQAVLSCPPCPANKKNPYKHLTKI